VGAPPTPAPAREDIAGETAHEFMRQLPAAARICGLMTSPALAFHQTEEGTTSMTCETIAELQAVLQTLAGMRVANP